MARIKYTYDFNELEKRPEFWIFIGLLASDGWITSEYNIGFQNTELNLVEFVNQFLHTKVREAKASVTSIKGKRTQTRKSYYVFCSRKLLYVYLTTKFRFSRNKTYDPNFGYFFDTIPEKFHTAFLYGYYLGDGNANIMKVKQKYYIVYRYTITSLKQRITQEIIRMLDNLDIQSTVYYNRKQNWGWITIRSSSRYSFFKQVIEPYFTFVRIDRKIVAPVKI